MLRSVRSAKQLDVLLDRLSRLRTDSTRRWGRMTPHQAVCHLADAMRVTLGETAAQRHRIAASRRVVAAIAFTLPVRWPRGFRTARELDQERDGTQPVDFERDRAELAALLQRVASVDARTDHPFWGPMSPGMTGRYTWRHMDHHLRQFGV